MPHATAGAMKSGSNDKALMINACLDGTARTGQGGRAGGGQGLNEMRRDIIKG